MKLFGVIILGIVMLVDIYAESRQNITRRSNFRIVRTPRTDLQSSILTNDKNNFAYRAVGVTVQNINSTIRFFDQTTKNIEAILSNSQENPIGMHNTQAWGGLYANMPRLTGKGDSINSSSPAYVLSLLYLSRFPAAEKAGKAILAKEPDHYGAIVLLGLLAEYKQEYFSYFERAFVMNPRRTLWIWDWHFKEFTIPNRANYDFVDALFKMLIRQKHSWFHHNFPDHVLMRIQRAFKEKYGDYFTQEQRAEIAPELLEIADRIVFHPSQPSKSSKEAEK